MRAATVIWTFDNAHFGIPFSSMENESPHLAEITSASWVPLFARHPYISYPVIIPGQTREHVQFVHEHSCDTLEAPGPQFDKSPHGPTYMLGANHATTFSAIWVLSLLPPISKCGVPIISLSHVHLYRMRRISISPAIASLRLFHSMLIMLVMTHQCISIYIKLVLVHTTKE
jgi:hypothetical protein